MGDVSGTLRRLGSGSTGRMGEGDGEDSKQPLPRKGARLTPRTAYGAAESARETKVMV